MARPCLAGTWPSWPFGPPSSPSVLFRAPLCSAGDLRILMDRSGSPASSRQSNTNNGAIPNLSVIVERLQTPSLLASVPNQAELQKQLSETRETFAKLKFNISELEAKQAFLSALCKDSVEIDVDIIDGLELQSSEARSKLKAVKQEIAHLDTTVITLSDQVSRQLHSLTLLHQSAVEVADARANASAERAAEANLDRFGRVDAKLLTADTESSSEAILDAQANVVKELNDQIQQLKDSIEQLQWKSEPLSDELKKIGVNDPTMLLDGLSPRVELASKLAQAVQFLGSCRLISAEAERIVLELKPEAAQLSIQFDREDGSITDAALSPANSVQIEDIVEWCRSNKEEGLPFLVNEIRFRISEAQANLDEQEPIPQSDA